jgi:hypothetical protein
MTCFLDQFEIEWCCHRNKAITDTKIKLRNKFLFITNKVGIILVVQQKLLPLVVRLVDVCCVVVLKQWFSFFLSCCFRCFCFCLCYFKCLFRFFVCVCCFKCLSAFCFCVFWFLLLHCLVFSFFVNIAVNVFLCFGSLLLFLRKSF